MVGPFYPAIRRNLARQVLQSGIGALLLALTALGCQASVSGDVKTRVRHDAEDGPEDVADFNKPIEARALIATPTTDSNSPETTLLGARQDMTLVLEQASATCACVKAAIGAAPSSAFKWQGNVPRLNDDTQLALALTSEGVPCQNEPKGSSGASYWGYKISGNDVVVFVEGARPNRPRAGAAIIPKPVQDGQVYIAPAKSKLPYGRPLDGKGTRCPIGSASPKRVTPFTAGELGDTSLNHSGTAPGVDAVE